MAANPIQTAVESMLAAREAGEINDLSFYGDTSWDKVGHYASAYLALYRRTRSEAHLTEAGRLLRTAVDKADQDGDGHWGWGLDAVHAPSGKDNPPFTVYSYTTSVIGFALLDAWEQTAEPIYLSSAERAAETIVTAVGFDETESGICFRYTDHPNDHGECIHNASVYSAALLALVDRARGTVQYENLVRQAVAYAFARQGTDGLWPYRDGRPEMNDLTHQAMMVRGMIEIAQVYDDPTAWRSAERGLGALREMLRSRFDSLGERAGHAWAVGDTLIALTRAQKAGIADVTEDRRLVIEYALSHLRDPGFIFDRSPRSQSWIAQGLSESLPE